MRIEYSTVIKQSLRKDTHKKVCFLVVGKKKKKIFYHLKKIPEPINKRVIYAEKKEKKINRKILIGFYGINSHI